VIGLCASSIGFMLMPAIPRDLFGSSAASAIAYAVVVFWLDCGALLFFLPYLALRQRVTPDALLGRMTSTMRFLTVAMAPLGAAGAGMLGERFGVRGGLASSRRARPAADAGHPVRHPPAPHRLSQLSSGSRPGSSTQIWPRCFMRPAFSAAWPPKPKKKSARTAPRIAPPVSWPIIRRCSGTSLAGSVVARKIGAPSGRNAGRSPPSGSA
jgi:hypothetical protein